MDAAAERERCSPPERRVILCVGAGALPGRGAERTALGIGPTDEVVIFEPDRRRLPLADPILAPSGREARVVPALLRLAGLPDRTHDFNVPWLCSRLGPDMFRASFPGLRTRRQVPALLIEQAELPGHARGGEARRELRIDFVGEALPLLQALQGREELTTFDRIVARVARRGSGAVPDADAVEQALIARHFRVRYEVARDPDFPLLVAVFAPSGAAYRSVAAERRQAAAEQETLRSRLAQVEAEQEAALADQAAGARAARSEAALRRDLADLQAQHAALWDKRDGLRSLLAEVLGALEADAPAGEEGA